jgi:hypothetical protein
MNIFVCGALVFQNNRAPVLVQPSVSIRPPWVVVKFGNKEADANNRLQILLEEVLNRFLTVSAAPLLLDLIVLDAKELNVG